MLPTRKRKIGNEKWKYKNTPRIGKEKINGVIIPKPNFINSKCVVNNLNRIDLTNDRM